MLGNPYSSLEPGLGPLMRDVKNKICQDCELVALLEDDNGMELLVNNKIISLDLPVREVKFLIIQIGNNINNVLFCRFIKKFGYWKVENVTLCASYIVCVDF